MRVVSQKRDRAQNDAAVLALVERDSVQEPQRGELGGPRESRGVPAASESLPSKSSTPRCDDRRCRRLTMYLVTTDSAALSVPILTLAVKNDPGGWYGFAILWPPPSVTPGTRRRRTHPPRRRGAPTTCRGRCPAPDAHCPRRWPEANTQPWNGGPSSCRRVPGFGFTSPATAGPGPASRPRARAQQSQATG